MHAPRRRFITLALATSAIAAAPRAVQAGAIDRIVRSVKGESDANRATVVLLDLSASIGGNDSALHRDAFNTLTNRMRAGDRLALGPITDRPTGKYAFVFDATAKVRGNEIDDRSEAERLRRAAREAFAAIAQPAKPSAKSFLLDSIQAAAELLSTCRQTVKRIALLSDGLEESTTADFTRQKADSALAERLLVNRKRVSMVPALAGVEVYLIGAGGRTIEEYGRLKAFWTTYVQGAGGTIAHYGRVVPDFK